ncbi:MAG TPA: HDIG domain-containing protein [Thermodesulfobacteriota bacterium]|nr:HDIG domain-containing protein [Thermodesulfobacteriota bacterium]
MEQKIPTRQEALELLHRYNESDSLRKHAYAVEAVMRHIARKRGQDEEKWGIIGLIHDLDYENFPEQHCSKTGEILREHGWPEEYIRAAVSHGWGICSDVMPESDLEKFLYAVDELTGLVVTTALIRPSKSVLDVQVKSVRNKWKDKRFAAGVDRSVIEKGAGMLQVSLDELIDDTIKGMQEVAETIGLRGNAA